MAKNRNISFIKDFSFYEQLHLFYSLNRGKIRTRYKDLTKKFLAYNDRSENPSAFLWLPQFEALEIYIFIKEFLNNEHMYKIFDDWRKRENKFSDMSYYAIRKTGESLFIDLGDSQNDIIFKTMEAYKESYPNYIYALTMGLGKTILMATCIFYEFLLSNKYPKNKIYCHNALVFAPDKTVLQSLKEIMTFDKTKVIPPEYAKVLDSNIKFHFLDSTDTSLQTIDGSNFNIIISNNQKIIVKRKRKEDTATDKLFDTTTSKLLSDIYGVSEEDIVEAGNDESLISNQRFKKLCRLPQLGVYVDEAHHLFGTDLVKELKSDDAEKTTLRNTINLLSKSTSIVACYNYTGTPYVDKQVLPEVVYAYGLKESIEHKYLKDADPIAFQNVKDSEFIRQVIKMFWEKYGNKVYEGLAPKLAFYASTIQEATKTVRPLIETVLSDLGVPISSILVNVGDSKITTDEDIRIFNDLDVAGTEASKKQFIILVGKGKEGWNCRSLLGVALFRNPKSKNFILQSTMRCLRKLTNEQLKATVFLSKENYDILNDELDKNYNMTINDLSSKTKTEKKKYKVRVMPPPRTIKMKKIYHEYKLIEHTYEKPIYFGIKDIDNSKYETILLKRNSLLNTGEVKKENADYIKDTIKYSAYTLIAEIARYMNISCLLVSKILNESVDGQTVILEKVNKYNDVLYDVIVPKIFSTLYEVKAIQHTKDVDLVLLHNPDNGLDYYEFTANDDLVINKDDKSFSQEEVDKSFHADTYCFDSLPEKRLFEQFIGDKRVKKIYFTGMFTAGQGDLFIQYYDPSSGRLRHYYPDFLAQMEDGSYKLIEVKGNNMIDNDIVKAKQEAAEEMAVASGIEYKIYPSSEIMSRNVILNKQEQKFYSIEEKSENIQMVAEDTNK